MDWSRVPLFLKVVEQGSFTAAAKALGVPKSTTSRAVTALEHELNVQLINRTTRALELTDAGRAFHARAKAAGAALDEAQAELQQHADEVTGRVRLSVPNDAMPMVPVLSAFAKKYPGVEVEVLVSNRHVNLIEEGIDLALRAGRLDDSTLIARRVAQSDLGIFASPEYLRRRGVPRKPEDLSKHELVLFRARGPKAKVRLESVRSGEQREVSVRGQLSADDVAFIRGLVLSGAGLGFLPVFFLGVRIPGQHLEPVLPDWRIAGSGVHLVMPAQKYVPARVRLLADFIYENFNPAACSKH